jgi:hypothetical protein
MDFSAFGRWMILAGLILAIAGVLVLALGKIPHVGRLPGDIYIKRDHVTFYFPIVTCLVISLLLTVLLRLFGKR